MIYLNNTLFNMHIPITGDKKPPRKLVAEDLPYEDWLNETSHYFDKKTFESPTYIWPKWEDHKIHPLKVNTEKYGRPLKLEEMIKQETEEKEPIDFKGPRNITLSPLTINAIISLIFFILWLCSAVVLNESRNGEIITALEEIQQDKAQLNFIQNRIRSDVETSSGIVSRIETKSQEILDKFGVMLEVKKSKIVPN